MTRSSFIIAGGAIVAAATLATRVEGHIMQKFPMSRQLSYGPEFRAWDDPLVEYCPHCYNARGPKYVEQRSKDNTDQATLDAFGGGEEFPLYYGQFAANGNYLETDEIAVRHGICGDPEQNADEGSNRYSTANINWDVIDSFRSGQVLEMDIVMNAYHWGHCEFFICNTDTMADPDGLPTQGCFNQHPLTRASDDGDASPIDPDYPGRYYVDPNCRGNEVEQGDNSVDGYNIRMRYVLPDIECEHCILQMVYYTGNTCKHIGYDEFNPPSWPSSCAPNKEDWIELDRSVCGTNSQYPEEFWACSDISLTSDGSAPPPTPAATPEPTDAATPEPTDAATPEPTDAATPEPTDAATPEPTDAATPEPTDATTPGPTDAATPEPTDEATPEPTDAATPGPTDAATPEPTDAATPEPTDEATPEPSYMATPEPTTTTSDDGDDHDNDDGDDYDDDNGDDGGDDYDDDNGDDDGDDDDMMVMYEYVGCFSDKQEDRVLDDMDVSATSMTAEYCYAHCSQKGAAFMATQFGLECFCSTNGELDFDRHDGDGRVCDYPCTGDADEICGGLHAFSLYELMPKMIGCSGDRVEAHEQCGGDSWTGSTCCTDGYECTVMGSGTCYSECRPSSY